MFNISFTWLIFCCVYNKGDICTWGLDFVHLTLRKHNVLNALAFQIHGWLLFVRNSILHSQYTQSNLNKYKQPFALELINDE